MYLRFRAKLEKLEAISTIFEGLGKVRKVGVEFGLYMSFRAKLEKLEWNFAYI